MTLAYTLDPQLSRFTVQGFAGGILSTFAHNPKFAIRDFQGEVTLTEKTIEPASLRLRIKPSSLELIDNVSDRDRAEIERTMREEVLEAESYPEVFYDATASSAAKKGDGRYVINLEGKLSLHGVMGAQGVSANLALDADRLHAYGEFSLNQSTYNIKLVRVAGGAIRLKDELRFSFDLVGRRQG
jgi:polyisoprenoid-binding protein YceI